MKIKQIFEPRKDPMRIVVLFSGGASAVPFMVNNEGYKVKGAISSSKNASGIEKVGNYGIPVEVNDVHSFYGEFGASIKNMEVREKYDRKNLSIIQENKWEPDVIACSGYMYFLTPVF